MTARTWTDSKLRFAAVHLEELRQASARDKDDFHRAHEESFLFHLHGARDGFLHEVNEHHGLGIPADEVTLKRLRKELKETGKKNRQVAEIRDSEKDQSTFLFRLKEWRDASTHRGRVPRIYSYVGGSGQGSRQLKTPKGATHSQSTVDEFTKLLNDMTTLITELRAGLAKTPR